MSRYYIKYPGVFFFNSSQVLPMEFNIQQRNQTSSVNNEKVRYCQFVRVSTPHTDESSENNYDSFTNGTPTTMSNTYLH